MNAPAPDLSKPAKEPFSWRREIQQWAVLILIVLGIHSFLAKPFYIPSESMMANLLVGDRLIVSKFPYGFSYLSPSVPVLPQMQGRTAGPASGAGPSLAGPPQQPQPGLGAVQRLRVAQHPVGEHGGEVLGRRGGADRASGAAARGREHARAAGRA